ncbi:hypothetical protein HEMA109418_07160 [Helcobacillus massiliensis]
MADPRGTADGFRRSPHRRPLPHSVDREVFAGEDGRVQNTCQRLGRFDLWNHRRRDQVHDGIAHGHSSSGFRKDRNRPAATVLGAVAERDTCVDVLKPHRERLAATRLDRRYVHRVRFHTEACRDLNTHSSTLLAGRKTLDYDLLLIAPPLWHRKQLGNEGIEVPHSNGLRPLPEVSDLLKWCNAGLQRPCSPNRGEALACCSIRKGELRPDLPGLPAVTLRGSDRQWQFYDFTRAQCWHGQLRGFRDPTVGHNHPDRRRR